MINLNWVFKIWLTAFVVTSGTWLALLSGARATSGSITIGEGKITQNGTIPTDSTINNRGNISGNPSNSPSNGGSIIKSLTSPASGDFSN